MPHLAANLAKWNLKRALAPRGFIEGFRPKGVSWIPANNMLYYRTLGIPGLLCTSLSPGTRCNQQGDVGYVSGTRLRTLRTLGFLAGLTSKPVCYPGSWPGHALTTSYIPQRTPESHEVSHHGFAEPGTTLVNVCY